MTLSMTYSVPGVYRRPQARETVFPRMRTDVAGFVGVAGSRYVNEALRIDDWRSYEQQYLRSASGDALDAPAGAMLAKSVRDFFANGGASCWIINIAERVDQFQSQVLLNLMLGLGDVDQVHGLELLLRQRDVSIVVLPELDALIESTTPHPDPGISLGPPCFVDCADIPGPVPPAQLPPATSSVARLFDLDQVLWAQRYFINRLQREPWRWFGIVSAPDKLDESQIIDWRQALCEHMDPDNLHCAALYWPWLLAQEKPGAAVEKRAPAGFVAGIFARRDLANGPHSAPANERLQAVVGLETAIDDRKNALVYDHGINPLRHIPGRGINLWGARTLSWVGRESRAQPLAYISARRCLSAIERTAEQIGQQVVFEPHSPLLRVQVSQAITGYLMSVFRAGALVGESAEQAFFVRCDSSNNPPEQVEQGQLLCEVGVALAVPAEFIVFRVGRREGVTEIEEVL